MSGGAQLTSVAYKKGNWMRYTLWGLAAICIGFLIWTFMGTLNGDISAVVPEGYKFSVTDNYNEGSKVRTTYYVYDDKVIVEDEGFESDTVNRLVLLYEDLNTTSLEYDADDTIQLCELGACHEKPKVLVVIKKLLSNKIGREYMRL